MTCGGGALWVNHVLFTSVSPWSVAGDVLIVTIRQLGRLIVDVVLRKY